MKPTHILTTLCLLCLLIAPAAAASVTDASGTVYTTYDQIYASTLSSSEKLALVQEMAGWSEELEAYMEWKNSGGLEAYQAAVSGNSTSSDYGWDEAPGDGLGDGGTNIEPEYSYQERQAYDAAYAAYQAEFAENYAATAAYTGSGSGTQADPYIITTPAELQSMQDDLDAYYKLGNDISFSGITYNIIGSPNAPFTGKLNGDGYIISDITVTSSTGTYGALFRTNTATFENIEFRNIIIKSPTLSSNPVEGYGVITDQSSKNTIISKCIFNNIVVEVTYSTSYNRDYLGSNFVCTGVIVSDSIFTDISLVASGAGNSIMQGNTMSLLLDSSADNILVNGLDSEFYMNYYSYVSGYSYGLSSGFIWGGSGVWQPGVFTDSIFLDGNINYKSGISGTGYRFSANNNNDNNYAVSTEVIINDNQVSSSTYNGQDITIAQSQTKTFYESNFDWDFTNTWYWDDSENLPKLQVFQKSVPPAISSISATPSIGGQQDTYTLSVSASTTAAGGIASYQWYGRIGSSGEWQAISGATSATYQFVPGNQALGDIYFKAVVTGADGGVVDSYDAGYTNVKITIILAPQISNAAANPTTGPLTQTVQLSADVTSTTTATYQWQEQLAGTWTNIQGATSATYSVSIADTAATLHSYRLQATNIGGTTTSTTVTYQSVAAPAISAVSATPTTGPLTQTVQLSATVTGATAYQWQQQSGSTWVNIQGATSATYSVSIADTAATLHSYRLQATNIGGTTTSNTVTYQSVAAPAISAVSATPTTGPLTQTVQLSATVTGATAYQWQQQTGSTWTNIQGATSATYTVSIADTAATLHTYRLQATNIGGTTTSATVTYQSVAAPAISAVSATPTTGPLSQTVQLSATVTGATAYQWQQQTGSTWTNIQGATSATYSVSIADTAATLHSYRLQATNIGGTTTSNPVTYQSVLPPAISAVSATPASGPLTQTVQLSVSATGAGSYQWQEQIGGSWTAISGATSATVSVNIADNAPTLHTYRVIVTGIGGTATSDSVTYQSSTGPLITAVSANPASGPLTQTVLLSVSAVSENPITYQWQEQLAGTWTNILGATAATYSVSIADTVQTVHTYRALATDVGGTTPSSTVSYSSIAPPQIQGANINPAIGKYTETITLSAEVTGADSYQWQQLVGNTWTNINGATTNPWVGTQTVTGDTQYRLQATNAGGTTSSAPIQYTIAGPATIQSLTATPSVVALPGSTVLQISGTNIIEVEWQQLVGSAWQTIGTGTSLSQTITTVGETSYRAVVLGTDGAQTTTNTIVVLSGYAPTVDIIEPVNGDEFGVGNTITAQGTITGTDVIYEWSFGQGGSGAQTNPTTITYTSQGYKTITLKAESIFGSAEDTVTILYGKAPRPMQTELFDTVDTSPVDNFMNQFDVTPGEMPNPVGIIGSLFQPFDDALKGFFWVLVFGAIMLVIWLITKNVAIPSVLGILFGAFMVGFMPDMYLYPAVALIAAGCAGGLLYVVRKN